MNRRGVREKPNQSRLNDFGFKQQAGLFESADTLSYRSTQLKGDTKTEYENEQLQKKVTAYEKNIKVLSESKNKSETNLKEAETKLKTLENELIESETRLCNERQKFETDANKKDEQLKEQNELTATHIKTLEMSNEGLKKELDRVKTVNSKELVARKTLEKELQDKASNYEQIIKNLEIKNDILLKKNSDHQNEIAQYQKELKCLKNKEKLQVQLLCKLDADLKTVLLDALAEHIVAHMNNEKLEVEIIKCMKASEIQPDMPLLLVCFNSHGRSANVRQLLKSMHVSSKVAILIIHFKPSHALPEEASDRVLVEVTESYPTLGGIYDMAFTPESGIYKCELNDLNIISITNFINRVGERKRAILLV